MRAGIKTALVATILVGACACITAIIMSIYQPDSFEPSTAKIENRNVFILSKRTC